MGTMSWSVLAVLSIASQSALRAQAPSPGPILPPSLPLRFVANHGQLPDPVAFTTRQGPANIFVTADGFVVQLVEGAPAASRAVATVGDEPQPSAASRRVANLMLDFEQPTGPVRPQGQERLAGLHAFYLGSDPAGWTTDVPAYARIAWRGVWPGIDIEVGSVARQVEYDVRVEPGASLDAVVLRLRGADALRLDGNGGLVADTSIGALLQTIPAAWEEDASGLRTPIEARFVVLDGMRFGFEAPGRDPSRRLVIDPGLDFIGLVATPGLEQTYGVAVDDVTGVVTMTGLTDSPVFPTFPGPAVIAGLTDVFVMQFTPLFAAVVYSVLIGGADDDAGVNVDVDPTGAAYVTGLTLSVGYPVTVGAFDEIFGDGGGDCFVTKLVPGGMALDYSTFLGGAAFEATNACIQVSDAGVATVAGYTESPDYPVTAGTLDRFYNGLGDIFVSQLDVAGGALEFSTFVGGTDFDIIGPNALHVDDGGLITLGGWTFSADFPVTPGSFDPLYAALEDGVLLRLSPTASFLLFSTYLGDIGIDGVNSIDIDDEGDVYAAGGTDSIFFPGVIFVVIGPFFAGIFDGFLTKLDASGTALEYSTFVGGPDSEQLISVAVDRFGRAHAVGVTDGFAFPITPLSSIPPGDPPTDIVVVQIDPTATLLNYGSYLGTGGVDMPWHLELTPEGFVHIVGDIDPGAGLDGLVATFSFPCVDEGFSLPGVTDPQFMADGALLGGDPFVLTLTEAPPVTGSVLILSVAPFFGPFLGGVLVPLPTFLIVLPPTGVDGTFVLPGVWPAGLPAGLAIWMQIWIPGAFGGPAGTIASNGIMVEQP